MCKSHIFLLMKLALISYTSGSVGINKYSLNQDARSESFSSQSARRSTIKPIIFMHGIMNNPREPDFPETYIPSKLSGAIVYPIRMYNYVESLVGLSRQLDHIIPYVKEVMSNHSDTGVAMLCFSQGGVICRAIVQMLPDHNIHTLITLSSPIAGQYGLTSYISFFLPYKDRRLLWRFLYTREGQDVSIGSYWNDPYHQKTFTDPKLDVLLARLNNQTGHSQSKEYRENFLRLKKFVMIGGPNDTVITPWQSAIMGFYDAKEMVVPMVKQSWYMNDAFGLKTLNEANKVYQHIIPGIDHIRWYRTAQVYDCCILPYL